MLRPADYKLILWLWGMTPYQFANDIIYSLAGEATLLEIYERN